jgi:hypothetical protein
MCYNEEKIIGFTVNYYKRQFPACKITICDNESSDKSVEIAKSLGCDIHTYSTDGAFNETALTNIRNTIWKKATTKWVIVCDMDEILTANQKDILLEQEKGTTILKVKGYEVFANSKDENLSNIKNSLDKITKASHAGAYSKNVCFDKTKITDINFSGGSHTNDPKGEVKFSEKEYLLYHYKHLGFPYYKSTHMRSTPRAKLAQSRGIFIGHHYTLNDNKLKNESNMSNYNIENVPALETFYLKGGNAPSGGGALWRPINKKSKRTNTSTRKNRRKTNIFNKSFVQIGGIENDKNDQKYIFINLLKDEGLGNQLFIFAAGLVIKQKTGLPICIIPSSRFKHSTFDYSLMFNTKRTTNLNISPERIEIAENILPRISSLPEINSIRHRWSTNNIKYNKSTIGKDVKLPFTLYQNYQSVKSAIPELKEILTRTEFSKDKYKNYNNLIKSNETAFMHVRKGDYNASGLSLPIEFFMKALDQLEKSDAIKTIYIFSDDIKWCEDHNDDWKKHTTKQIIYDKTKNEIDVLYMMSLCSAGAIISNSTFSSWGAMLGADMNPDSMIVYSSKIPNMNNGTGNPYDYPERWIGITPDENSSKTL